MTNSVATKRSSESIEKGIATRIRRDRERRAEAARDAIREASLRASMGVMPSDASRAFSVAMAHALAAVTSDLDVLSPSAKVIDFRAWRAARGL